MHFMVRCFVVFSIALAALFAVGSAWFLWQAVLSVISEMPR